MKKKDIILIKWNKYRYDVYIYKHYQFFNIFLKNDNYNLGKFTKKANLYIFLLKILRQFGLINSLKNIKNY